MDELNEFIKVLRGECQVLIDKSQIQPGELDAWRFYSTPTEDEEASDHLRAIIEAGKHTVESEQHFANGNEIAALTSLVRAQTALLKSISAIGKAESKKIGQAKGGRSRGETIYIRVLIIADELIEQGAQWRGLASKVAIELSHQGIDKREDWIKQILDKNKTDLVNR